MQNVLKYFAATGRATLNLGERCTASQGGKYGYGTVFEITP